jgi:hypothetical protein
MNVNIERLTIGELKIRSNPQACNAARLCGCHLQASVSTYRLQSGAAGDCDSGSLERHQVFILEFAESARDRFARRTYAFGDLLVGQCHLDLGAFRSLRFLRRPVQEQARYFLIGAG